MDPSTATADTNANATNITASTTPEPYPGHDETCNKFMNHAKAVHLTYPLLDGHNDLPWALRCCFDMKWSLLDLRKDWTGNLIEGCPWRSLHTDIPRLRKGGVGAQLWSVYMPTTGSDGDPIDPATAIALTLEQIDIVHSMCELYSDVFEMVQKADDIERIFNAGKIPSMCGVEGGHQIGGSLRALRMFHKLGVRYMTLTHNGGPGWADPAVNSDGSFAKDAVLGGLNDFGKEVVLEMNRIGMTVDLSHVHAETMHAALDVTKAPVLFSHSSTRALCRHPRDVPDDVLKRLPKNGGVIMIVFLSKFVAGEFWVAGGKVGATILEVADHVDRVVELAGIDHVGIGGDYDGGALFARGLEDVSKYPALTCELLKRGYTDNQLGKLLGRNVIRVLKECEVVSEQMKTAKTPIGEAHWGPELYETNAMKENRLLSPNYLSLKRKKTPCMPRIEDYQAQRAATLRSFFIRSFTSVQILYGLFSRVPGLVPKGWTNLQNFCATGFRVSLISRTSMRRLLCRTAYKAPSQCGVFGILSPWIIRSTRGRF